MTYLRCNKEGQNKKCRTTLLENKLPRRECISWPSSFIFWDLKVNFVFCYQIRPYNFLPPFFLHRPNYYVTECVCVCVCVCVYLTLMCLKVGSSWIKSSLTKKLPNFRHHFTKAARRMLARCAWRRASLTPIKNTVTASSSFLLTSRCFATRFRIILRPVTSLSDLLLNNQFCSTYI
jgi:hypothetical protein